MDPPEELRITRTGPPSRPPQRGKRASSQPNKRRAGNTVRVLHPVSPLRPGTKRTFDRRPPPRRSASGQRPSRYGGDAVAAGTSGRSEARSGIARGSARNGHRLLGERRLGDRASGSPSRRRRPQRHAIPRARPLAVAGRGTGGAGMSPAVLSGVLGVMERHGLRPPRALLLLTRTLLTLEATLRLIDPEFDLARPRPRSSSARRARVLGHAGGDPAPRAHPRAAGAAQSPGARRDPGRSATGRAPGPALRALCRRGPAGGAGVGRPGAFGPAGGPPRLLRAPGPRLPPP